MKGEQPSHRVERGLYRGQNTEKAGGNNERNRERIELTDVTYAQVLVRGHESWTSASKFIRNYYVRV